MKKKLSIFALIILVLPLFALLGCGKTGSYKISVFPSDQGFGQVIGMGEYKEGKSVTLTATATKGRFVAWVYEDSLLISNNSTYKINNKTSGNSITKSELTFKATAKTKGKYMAVFDEEKIVFTKLTSWRITDDLSKDSETEGPTTMSTTLYVSQGSSNIDAYSVKSFETADNVTYKTNKVNEVLKLNGESAQNVSVEFTVFKNATPSTNYISTEIPLHESIDNLNDSDNPTKVTYYANLGVYEIVFKFTLGEETLFLVLNYTNLNKIM